LEEEGKGKVMGVLMGVKEGEGAHGIKFHAPLAKTHGSATGYIGDRDGRELNV